MKLRNKKTGEIGEPRIQYQEIYVDTENHITHCYKTLRGMLEEWCDYEEPKDYWIIDTILHEIRSLPYKNNEEDKRYEQWLEELGLKFETEEEAKQAVEKLKAFKRLKDKGLEFEWVDKDIGSIKFAFFNREGKITKEMWQDIDLLFGDEK